MLFLRSLTYWIDLVPFLRLHSPGFFQPALDDAGLVINTATMVLGNAAYFGVILWIFIEDSGSFSGYLMI